MLPVKKVEIIVNHHEVNQALRLLDSVGISGYTVVENAHGKGERGVTSEDIDLSFRNTYIMTVCTNEKQLQQLVDAIKPLLMKVGGVCLVSEASWVVH